MCGDRDASSSRAGDGTRPAKVYGELDAVAGVYVSPGERFDVRLDAPERGAAHTWRVPDLGGAGLECLDLLDGDEAGRPLPVDPISGLALFRCRALRPGYVKVSLVAVSPGDGHRADAITVPISVDDNAIPGDLGAILAVCRDDSTVDATDARAPVPCTPRALLAHSFFQPLTKDDLADAMDSYNRLFLAVDDDDLAAPGLPYPTDASTRAPATPGRRLDSDLDRRAKAAARARWS